MTDNQEYENLSSLLGLKNNVPNEVILRLWRDMSLSIGNDPEKDIQENIKAAKERQNFNAKQHWINIFGTEPSKE